MNKKQRIIIVSIAFLIGIISLFFYIINDQWLVGIGIGLYFLILTIMARLNKKEFELNYKKMSKNENKLLDFLNIILWVVYAITLIIAFHLFLKGEVKEGVFLLMLCFLYAISSWGCLK